MNLRKPPKLKTVEDLREFIREFFKGKPVKVYLFGSRAKGSNSPYSDVDIAVDSKAVKAFLLEVEGMEEVAEKIFSKVGITLS